MSENSEHSPDDTEMETKAMEDLPNDSSKSEAKLMMNQTDTALLEDEEMPTYISVSSTTKPDDSDVANVKQPENESREMERDRSSSPYPSDDQAANSVYVLSSGEETDQHPYNDEDDEDEYGDSDDMENLEHPSNNKHLMDDDDDEEEDEEEEEDDEDNLRKNMNNDDDGIDDNYETDYYDGRSDDFLLNRRLKNHDEERSLSLQDLNTYENNTGYYKRRHLQRVKQNLTIPEHDIMYSMIQKKQGPMSAKYHHVQSKVKRYIKDVKEQNRRSIEKYIKQHQEDTIYISNTDHKNNDTERTKPTVTNKTIKDYAERTIKELEIAETCDSNMDKVAYNATTSPQIILNGQDNTNCLESIREESIQNEIQIPFEPTQNERDLANTNNDNKIQKQNGTIEIKQQLKFSYPDREVSHFEDAMQPSLIQNGHQEVPTVVYNLRTLSYEEYMHGTSDPSQKTDLNRNAHVIEQESVQPETYNSDLMDISTDNEDACPLRIENIKSIKTMSDEAKNNEQITLKKTNEFNETTLDTSEVIALKKKLTQKTVKYNSLLDTYQKQLMENLKMKQELDELRKTLAKYEKENKPPELKVASIQTDTIIESVPDQHQDQTKPTSVKQSNNKISGSSVASTLSSIDQWSSSACNLSISMKPPEVAKTLHSDDSMILTDGTPGKTRSLSHAFITSSRILKTLSSITQGKTKPESPLTQNSKKRLNENVTMDLQSDDSSYQCQPSSSKKRKLADLLGQQSFKASQTATESHPKLNETSNVESQFKDVCDSINNVDLQASSSNANTSQLRATTSTIESKMDTLEDPDDNVKCYVYREDENSKDRSFLILAEEPEKDKTINEKGRIRECGPYLLGNVEVRMSEINGTINIWGKEVSQESTAENENETETSTKVKDKNDHCWQKTPYTRFNGSNLVCSTSKKSKIPPKFELSSAANSSNFSYLHSPLFDPAKASCSTDKAHVDKLHSPSACVSSCEDCDFSNHCKKCLRYKRICLQEKLHSCCIHNTDTSEQKCNCSLHKEKQKFEDSFNYSKDKLNTQEHRRSLSRDLEPNKHLYENNASKNSEHICRNCTTCHHSLQNPDNYQESHILNKMLKETRERMNTDREYESCNHSSPVQHEEEPLIILNQCSETSETRRRRLTGKRVREILMDLIRGCGDCYNPNVSSNNKSCTHKKEFYLKSSPQIKISPCASPEPSCSNSQPAGRCCHAYAQRIESQLEEFRMEMERMRSRSDAILNMLNMLHSVDTN